MTKYIVEDWGHKTVWKNENGNIHREDGPAIEKSTGSKMWYINGKLHRENGPAVEWSTGNKEWWINGENLTEFEFNERTKQPTCEGKVIEIEGVKYKLTKV